MKINFTTDFNSLPALIELLVERLGENTKGQWILDCNRGYQAIILESPTLIDQHGAAVEEMIADFSTENSRLQREKMSAKAKLFHLAETHGKAPYKNVTRVEADSWAAKGAEFDAFQLDADAACPILAFEAQCLGVNFTDFMVAQVAPKVTAHRQFAAALKAAQSLLETEIEACVTFDELSSCEEGLAARLQNTFAGFLVN